MDIGKNIQRAMEIYMENCLLMFIFALTVCFLSGLTFCILAGPLAGGFFIICLKLQRSEKVDFMQLFACMNKFVPGLVFMLMVFALKLTLFFTFFIPVIGPLLVLATAPAATFIFMSAIGMIMEKNKPPVEAIFQSINLFMTAPLIHWLYALATEIFIFFGLVPYLYLGVLLLPSFGLRGFLALCLLR